MTESTTSPWSFPFGLLRSGSGALLLAAVLTLDACSLPPTTVVGSITSPASWRTGCRFDLVILTVWRDGARLVLVDEGRAPGGEPGPVLSSAAEEVGNLFFAPARARDAGLWAPTERAFHFTLYINGPRLGAEEIAVVRSAFADTLLASRGGALAWQAPMVRAGSAPAPQALASGYIHNGISLAVFGALVASLASARSWPELAAGRERRRLRALEAGLCPNCRYEIRGLPQRRCPECGEEW